MSTSNSTPVRVRLVPKSRVENLQPGILFDAMPARAKEMSSRPDLAQSAFSKAYSMGAQPALSSRNRLDLLMTASQVHEIFRVDLQETTSPVKKGRKKKGEIKAELSYLEPKGSLQVPAELENEIAFAYMPTPPTYFGLDAVPPLASVYHLRVEDVARCLRAYGCHRQGWTGKGIKIAMADSGFSPHPFFTQYGFNIQRVTTPTTSNPAVDPSGHGTGESANALVVAPDCTFIGVKHDDYSAEALETSLAQSPRVITNSWGYDIDNQSLSSLSSSNPNMFAQVQDIANIVQDAVADGVVVVFSGGNGHRAFPACLPDVIAVGGVTVKADGTFTASSYASSFASKFYPPRQVPDFCGIVGEYNNPGPMKGHIMLPVPNGSSSEGSNLPASANGRGWGIFSGTSASAPQIAGVVALMLSVDPTLTPQNVKQILVSTSRDVISGKTALGDTAVVGPDQATGAGFVDALAACLRVQQNMTGGGGHAIPLANLFGRDGDGDGRRFAARHGRRVDID